MRNLADTIVAAATPPGSGGIGIVRVSGELTRDIARTLLGSLPEPRNASYRTFRDGDGRSIEAGIAVFFPAPASFTGEPVLELHGHGGPVVVGMLVDAVVALGARRAEPGEFSERAFINGKLDLAQAEAVVDLINAGTACAARAALRSLDGHFSATINALADELMLLRTHVEAAIDFPDEEIDFLSDDALLQRLEQCRAAFAEVQKGAVQGRLLRDGFQVVIVGRPNAGKSSLMNVLSGQDAAIVTEIAGTTRDILREQIDIDGLAVELADTAGLRDNPDRIESEGIRRARRALENADAVLWIRDAADAGGGALDDGLPPGMPVTVVNNKVDLTGDRFGPQDDGSINVSAKTGEGIDSLRARIAELAGFQQPSDGAFTARRRHIEALERAYGHFESGRAALSNAGAGEILAEELRLSHHALGEITGTVTTEELLGRIFSEFCIGK